MFEFERIRIYY